MWQLFLPECTHAILCIGDWMEIYETPKYQQDYKGKSLWVAMMPSDPNTGKEFFLLDTTKFPHNFCMKWLLKQYQTAVKQSLRVIGQLSHCN